MKTNQTKEIQVLTPFRKALIKMELTPTEFSKLSGQPLSTLYDWINGKYPPLPAVMWGIENFLILKLIFRSISIEELIQLQATIKVTDFIDKIN